MNMTFEQMLNKQQKIYTHIKLKINGELSHCNITSSEEFYHLAVNLCAEPFMDDEQKYWVLYEKHEDLDCGAFWCIPIEEINFIFNEDYQLIGWVTLDEGNECTAKDEEIISIEEYSYRDCLEKFNQFTTNFMHYVLFNKYADEDNFRIWKKLRTWIDTPDEDICEDNKICLIRYLEEYWKAWLESIIDETYSYMYCTRIVWEAWEEFCS